MTDARVAELVERAFDYRGYVTLRRSDGSEMVALAVGVGGGSRGAVVEKQPRLVVSCGFSGGLDPALAPGDLVIATAVRDETGDELAAPQSVRQQALQALRGLRCFEGELLCTTSVAATEGEKLALARPGTLAVDMESHPAARAAAEAGVPWLAIRAIVDPLRSSLPSFAREPHASYLGPALKYALSGPRSVGDLLRLARHARIAAAALEAALRWLGPMLAAAEAHP